jgi:hypothetical protein
VTRGNHIHWRIKMSDEIKKVEDEVGKAEPSAELSEPALDEVAGGTAASFLNETSKRGSAAFVPTPSPLRACATAKRILPRAGIEHVPERRNSTSRRMTAPQKHLLRLAEGRKKHRA